MSSASTPMMGTWTVDVKAVRPFAIHGDLYYELHVERADEPSEAGILIRIPPHAAATAPKAGERLVLTFLMGQVTSAAPAA